MLRRIRVAYRLRAGAAERETIERVHGFHARFCPVYRSLRDAISIETELTIVDE